MQLRFLYFVLPLIPASLATTGYFYEKNQRPQSTDQNLQYTSSSQQQQQQQYGLHNPAAAGYFYEKNQSGQQANYNLPYSLSLSHHVIHSPAAISYEKEYFFFRAPEEDTAETETQQLLNTVKKRQQVIFVHTPMNMAYEKALENYLKNSAEKQTHIYVFSQRPNFDGLAQKFQSLPKSIHSKPEVHFVKYKTPAEIQNIQSSIIEQFAAASENKPVYSLPASSDNMPVSKNYAMNFLPTGIDVVPGSSYIPLFLF